MQPMKPSYFVLSLPVLCSLLTSCETLPEVAEPPSRRRVVHEQPPAQSDNTFTDFVNDENERNVRLNERILAEKEAQAAQGDQEAKAWVEQWGGNIRAARVMQNLSDRLYRGNGQ